MRFFPLVSSLFVLAPPLSGLAQGTASDATPVTTPSVPTTPAECVRSTRTAQEQMINLAREAGKQADAKRIEETGRRMAAECLQHFPVATTAREQLPNLALLGLVAGQDAVARSVVERAIELAPADSDKADVLYGALTLFMSGRDTSKVHDAERFLARLDAMPGLSVAKIAGYGRMASFYSNYDIDDRLRTSSQRILDLARPLLPEDQRKIGKFIQHAVQSLASLQANELHPDSAIAILKAAPPAFPGLVGLDSALAEDISRYAMIGKPAAEVQGDYWINVANNAPKPGLSGHVTVLTFTANWCHSCVDAYPVLEKLSKTFRPRGMQVVLAVNLDGQFQGEQMAPEQEVEANRRYFVEHHHFDFPIAVQREAEKGDTATEATRNTTKYQLYAWPQFVVIDRTGVIRAVLMGWDPYGNRAKALTKAVERAMS